LRGVRVVSAIEVSEGKRFAEALVKQLTGQDTLTARFLFQEFFQFKPQCKLFLACNHKPVIRGTDHAIWRRIRLVPFTITIPEAEQDHQLAAKLRAELPGILTWAVQGCLAWQQEGLAPPPAVQQATAGYRQEMDIVGQFLAERCLVGPGYRVPATLLYEAYRRWCDVSGEAASVQRAFGMGLSERGYERYKVMGKSWWRGLALVDEMADTDTTPEPVDEVDDSRPKIRKVSPVMYPQEDLKDSSSTSSTSSTHPAQGVSHLTPVNGARVSLVADALVPAPPHRGAPCTATDTCPHGDAHQWENHVTYRRCQRCGVRDGQTPAEILGQPRKQP